MKPISIILIISLCIIYSNLYSQERSIARISTDNTDRTLAELRTQEYQITSVSESYIDILIDHNQLQLLKNNGYNAIISTSESQLKKNLSNGRKLEAYLTYDEIYNQLLFYTNNYPDICSLYDIGNSLGKDYFEQGYNSYEDYQHDIWALKISDNPDIEEDEPSLLYDGGHHARELIGPAVTLNFIDHLLTNYGIDHEVTEGIDNNQIWVVPVVNPDGYKIVIDSTEIWWRKTIRDNNGNQVIDPFLPNWIEPDGVDPNRNYGDYWGGDWSTVPSFRETYGGPYSFSENCTDALAELMNQHHFVTEISYHSYGEIVLYPWGYSSPLYQTPDHELYNQLASVLANMTPKLTSGNYNHRCSGRYSVFTGGTLDYAYGKHGTMAFLVELGDDFIPEPHKVGPICDANLNSQMYLLTRVHNSIVTGIITDAASGNPIEATISVEGIDNNPGDRDDYISDSLYGRYYRMLLPGTYEITFSKAGYESTTITGVEVTSSSETELNITLQPATSFTYYGLVTDIYQEPLINAKIKIEGPGFINYRISNESGFFQVENFYPGEYNFSISADHYFTQSETLVIDNENNSSVFELEEYEVIDFEETSQLDWFNMSGHHNWFLTNEESFTGTSSLVSPILSSAQISGTSIELTFDTDILMTVATKVSLDSTSQGVVFIMDEHKMKSYTWENDWVVDTFYISNGRHIFRWSTSRFYSNPAPIYQHKCWIDDITFTNLTTIIVPEEEITEPLITCFPNPSSHIFNVRFHKNVEKIYHAGIYDQSGKLLRLLVSSPTSEKDITWNSTTVNGSMAPNGIYIIKVVTDKGTVCKKLIKQ